MDENAPITNPLKAIREKCLDCCGGNAYEVRVCTAGDGCSLYPFRFGKNPYRAKRELSDEQREELANRLVKAREVLANSNTSN